MNFGALLAEANIDLHGVIVMRHRPFEPELRKDATDFFFANGEAKIPKGLRVLIYASRKSEGAEHLFVKGRATSCIE